MLIGNSCIRASVSALAIASAMSLSVPVQAQSDADEAESTPNEIVVTAQFRDQSLQDVPIAITAMSGEMLEARGQSDISDVGQQAPNVTLRQAPATYGPAIVAYIRGVGQRDTTFALEPGVGIYIDDVYLPTLHGSLLNLVDLDRVEILRGPQGTLAGQNSIGGAIKLYSKKPDGSDDAYAQATYGSYNRVEMKAGANFTLVPGKLFARLSGAGVHKDGYITRYDYACTHPGTAVPTTGTNIKDCKLGTEGGKDYVAGRMALRWEPSDRVSLDLVADITKDNSEVGPSTLLYVSIPEDGSGAPVWGPRDDPNAFIVNGVVLGTVSGSPFISYSPYGSGIAQDTFSSSPYINYENYADYAPRDGSGAWSAPLNSQLNTWGISANLNIELADNLRLESITGYREFDGNYSSGEGSPINVTLQANQIYNHQFSQELRFSGQVADIVTFTLGGYYSHKRSENVSRVTLPTLAFFEDNVIPATNKALFANVELAATDRLTLIGGVRYSDSHKEFRYGRKGVPGSSTGGATPAALAPLDGQVGEYDGTRYDYRGVVQYRWTDSFMTYAQISTGFKGGGVNPRPFFPAQALAHDPETLTAYEVGFKSDFLDRRGRLNVSGFWNKYNDILVTVSSCPLPGAPPAPCALPLNAGKAEVRGFEAELSLEPVRGFLIDASLAYLEFEYKSILAAAANSGIGLEDDGQYIMPWQWSIGAQYEIDTGSGTITPRVDVNFEDDFNRNANNVDAATGVEDVFGHLDSRLLVNGRITYKTEDENWQISLEGRNLTDKLYYTDVFDNRGSTKTIQGTPGEPRTWAVTVKRQF